MDKTYIIHGPPKINTDNCSALGEDVYRSLLQHETIPVALTDVATGEVVSYKALLEKSRNLARWLQTLNLNPNDIIAIYSENNVSYFYPVLAAMYLGYPVTTFNPQYTHDELAYTLNISKPVVIFCSESTLDTLLEVKKHLKFIKAVIVLDTKERFINGLKSLEDILSSFPNTNQSSFKPREIYSSEEIIFILYSSGTTGLPKGVMLTQRSIQYTVNLTGDPRYTIPENPGDNTSVALLPFYHFYGLVSTLIGLKLARKVVVMKSFDPELFLATLQDYKVKILYVVPPLANFLARSPLVDNYDLSSIELIACAAAPLSKKIEEALNKRLKYVKQLRQSYGLTEAVPILGFLSGDHKTGSCGKVLPGLSVKIVDPETGKILGPGKPGEICCKGDVVMKGYFNNIEATKAAFDEDGWLHTGDVAYYNKDGYFYIIDRIKELIKYKAFQVAPAELEALLLSHPKIIDAGVVGLPDEIAGELPLAFVVVSADQTLTEEEVKDFVAKKVSPHKQLRGGVKFVDEIPRNQSGKILRRKLRDSLVQKSKL